MTFLRATLLAAALAAAPLAATAATVSASGAAVFLDDLGGGVREISGLAAVGPMSGPFGPGAQIDFAIEFGPTVPGSATGFLELSDGTALLAGIPLSVLFEGTEAVVRLTFDAEVSTVAGFEQGFLARFDFGSDPASLAPGAEYATDISIAPVPLPASAALLLLGGAALAGLGRLRAAAPAAAG